MADLQLMVIASAALIGLAAYAGAMPFSLAVWRGQAPPRSLLLRGAGLVVAAGLVVGIPSALWLALELSDEAGPVGQRSVLEQTLPFLLALALTGCLIALPWRPDWVAEELRRIGLAVPIAGCAAGAIDAAVTGSGVLGLLDLTTGIWLLIGAGLMALGRLLAGGQRAR